MIFWQYLIAKNMVAYIDEKFPETGHSMLDSDRGFTHVEKVIRKKQNIYSVDEYQEIIMSSQKKDRPIITRLYDKFHEIKELSNLLQLSLPKDHWNTAGGKVKFRDKVRWIRVNKFGQYQYKESHDESEAWKVVRLTSSENVEVPGVTLTVKPIIKVTIKENKL